MANEVTESISREAPDIEAQKIALMRSAKAQVDATSVAMQTMPWVGVLDLI